MATIKLLLGFASAALVSGIVAGCAVDASEASDDDVEESVGELSAAGRALIGAYRDDSGPFRALVLTSERDGSRNKFFADVDTGIRCIQAPCPSEERIEGTFSAGKKNITLRSTTASRHVQRLLGSYKYLVQGNKFSLNRKGFSQSLEKVPNYCSPSQANDCYRQDIIHPMCVGQFECTPENTCKWSCGVSSSPCTGLDEDSCKANPECEPVLGPSWCSPDGSICSKDFAYKGCERKQVVCAGLSQSECNANSECEPVLGPSWCTPDGICSKDFAYKGCGPKLD